MADAPRVGGCGSPTTSGSQSRGKGSRCTSGLGRLGAQGFHGAPSARRYLLHCVSDTPFWRSPGVFHSMLN
jgi:hypothetical protein